MSGSSPTEQLVEDVAALHFAAIGAAVQHGVEIDAAGERADSSQCILPGRLTVALQRLNPDLPRETIEGVARTLARLPHPTLAQNNRWFHTLLVDGVEVEYRDARSGETRGGRVPLRGAEVLANRASLTPGGNSPAWCRTRRIAGWNGWKQSNQHTSGRS